MSAAPISGDGPLTRPILPEPILDGEEQSLSGTVVDIPGVGRVTFAPQSASDFPNMDMSLQELTVKYWYMEIAVQDLATRLQALELMANGND